MNKRAVVLLAALAVMLVLPARADVDVLEQTGNAFARIAKKALPAVVYVNVETTIEVPQYGYRYYDPFEQFFGRGRRGGYAVPEELEPRKYSQQGQGSGFIISKDGYILTNNHVVNNADQITVTLGDGRKFGARLVGTDPKTEVALIKIESGDEFPYLELGDSDRLEVGEWVLAAGNPFGLSQTITAGIVSAKGRSMGMLGEDGYENFIQTDAAINPGNSGGPLLNIRGEVVGINTAIYSRTGGYMGIGFAVPVNMAIAIKNQLLEHGKVSRSVLGVYIQEVDEDLARNFGLKESGGILISQVLEGSAAEAAGLKDGDIVVQLDGSDPGEVGAFRSRIAAAPPNTKVELKIFRDGKYKQITAITKAMDSEEEAADTPVAEPALYNKLGMSVEPLDKAAASRYGYGDLSGVIISEVEEGGAAWRAGLQSGLVILSVNRERVGNVDEFKEALAAVGESNQVLFLVKDPKRSRFVVLTVD